MDTHLKQYITDFYVKSNNTSEMILVSEFVNEYMNFRSKESLSIESKATIKELIKEYYYPSRTNRGVCLTLKVKTTDKPIRIAKKIKEITIDDFYKVEDAKNEDTYVYKIIDKILIKVGENIIIDDKHFVYLYGENECKWKELTFKCKCEFFRNGQIICKSESLLNDYVKMCFGFTRYSQMEPFLYMDEYSNVFFIDSIANNPIHYGSEKDGIIQQLNPKQLSLYSHIYNDEYMDIISDNSKFGMSIFSQSFLSYHKIQQIEETKSKIKNEERIKKELQLRIKEDNNLELNTEEKERLRINRSKFFNNEDMLMILKQQTINDERIKFEMIEQKNMNANKIRYEKQLEIEKDIQSSQSEYNKKIAILETEIDEKKLEYNTQIDSLKTEFELKKQDIQNDETEYLSEKQLEYDNDIDDFKVNINREIDELVKNARIKSRDSYISKHNREVNDYKKKTIRNIKNEERYYTKEIKDVEKEMKKEIDLLIKQLEKTKEKHVSKNKKIRNEGLQAWKDIQELLSQSDCE